MKEFNLLKKFNWELASKPIEVKHYKVYTALLNQTGVAAPVPTILENTLGNIVWSYVAAGNYKGTLTGAFLQNKYFAPIPSSCYDADVNVGGGGVIYAWYRLNDNEIIVLSGPYQDNVLNNSPFEIRIYN